MNRVGSYYLCKMYHVCMFYQTRFSTFHLPLTPAKPSWWHRVENTTHRNETRGLNERRQHFRPTISRQSSNQGTHRAADVALEDAVARKRSSGSRDRRRDRRRARRRRRRGQLVHLVGEVSSTRLAGVPSARVGALAGRSVLVVVGFPIGGAPAFDSVLKAEEGLAGAPRCAHLDRLRNRKTAA